MKIRHRLRCSAGCVLVLAIALAATNVAAQTTGGGASYDSNGGPATFNSNQGTHRQSKGQSTSSKLAPAAPSPVASVKDPWPRLDAGAILCNSRDDLVRYQKQVATGSASSPAPDCRIVEGRIGVKVLARDDPSHTQVALTDNPQKSGWTDVYLSSKPPN